MLTLRRSNHIRICNQNDRGPAEHQDSVFESGSKKAKLTRREKNVRNFMFWSPEIFFFRAGTLNRSEHFRYIFTCKKIRPVKSLMSSRPALKRRRGSSWTELARTTNSSPALRSRRKEKNAASTCSSLSCAWVCLSALMMSTFWE